jgi:PAS domain S-box-containing protein
VESPQAPDITASPLPERTSVLLVDDSPASQPSLRAILENPAYDLVEARTGEEALERLKADEFAVVLLDVRLPGMSGFDVAEHIRSKSRSPYTPVIFLTTDDIDRTQVEAGYALGAVDFFVKPLSPVVVQAKVRGFVTLFRQKERAKQEAEQLRLIVQGTTDYAIFMLDPNGNVATWNAGAERIKGYKADEIIGRHFSKFYPQDVIDRGWPEHELEVATAEGRFEDEGWRLRKDGSRFWANVVITALRDEKGQLRGFSKVTRDLTERKQAEEALRRSEERFRLIVESAKDYAIFLLDPQGHVASWNPGAERIKGYTADDIIGKHFSTFYPQEALDRGWPAHELKVAAAEGRFEDEGWRVRKDGSQFWANVVITALKDEQGKLLGFSKITRDLTARKQAEENARRLAEETAARRAAHEERERLRVTLASIGDAVISTDAQGRVDFLNPVAEDLLGWKSGEAAGQMLQDVFHIVNEDTRQPVGNPALRALRDGKVVGLANHTVLIARDGTERPIDDSAAPIRDATGDVIGSVLVFRDISERRGHEAALAERMRLLALNAAVGEALVQGNGLGAMLHHCAEALVEHLDGAFARIWTVNEAEDVLELRASAGMYTHLDGPHSRVPVGQYKIGLIAQERKPHLTNAVVGDPRVSDQEWARQEGMVAFAGYPLVVDGRLVGVMAMFARHELTDATLEAMASVADEIAVGIERKTNHERLNEQREWLSVTLASIGDAVMATDDRGRVTFLNAVAQELTGWRQADAQGKPLEAVFPIHNERTRQPVQNPVEKVLREGAIVGLANHTVLVARDGTEHPIDDSAAPIRDSSGKLIGVVLIFRDVTEQRRAEASLREQTTTAETLLRIGGLLAQELDQHRLVQVVTDEATRLCGAQFGAFFYNVVGDRGEAYTLYTLSGVPREAFDRFPMPRNTALFGPTFQGEGVVRLDDVTQDPRYGKSGPHYGMPEGHPPVRSYLALPVISRTGEVLGGLFFGHAEAGVFTARHERLLVGITGQAAVAIDNARLYQRTQASAERLNLALSAADLGDWSWDAASDVVTFSERAAEVFGIPPGPHMTWTALQDLLHPDDRDRARHEVERVVAERVQYDIEYRVNRREGSQVWVGVLGRAIYDSADRVVGMYGVVQDVTERKRLEESLRSSEERLRLALNAGRMGVWDWNIRTGDIKWSDSLEPLHGLAPGTFGGTFEDFQKLVHPDDREMVNRAIRRAAEDANGYDIEFRNVWPNGSVHWIAGKGKVFPGEDGQPGRMVGIGMDITQRKRAEQTARFLADASAALAVLVDFDSTLQKVASLAVPHFADWATVDLVENGGTLRRVAVAHVDPAKVELAHQLHHRFPPDPAAPQGVWNILRTGQSEIIPEITDELLVQSIREEERLRIVRELGLKSYIGVPLKVRGKALGVLTFIAAESGHHYDEADLATAQDLADRAAIAIENAQLYRELREADRRKDEFLATLAHELRNPLAPIRNGLQVLRLAGGGGEMVAEARSMMERQLGQMVRLVDDLLDVSRITRNKLELRTERVTLAAVVHSAVETSRPLMEQAGHTFSLTLPPTPVYIDADLTRLAQVFSNLLNNSAKYTEPGGRISLTGEMLKGEVVVRVRDNGLGIPAEAMPRLFQMFSQVDRNMERAQGGLGIGLTLVRRLTEMHGGTVQAHSEGPGKGSEFIVRLPVLKANPQTATVQGDGGVAATAKRRILVVDDNQDSAISLGMMLRLMGNEIQTAHDGLAAVEAAREFRPDMILLDIGLPKINGYDACRRIREQPWSRGMVIVALTGWGQEEDRRRSREAGFDHHLVKPVEIDALRTLLRED